MADIYGAPQSRNEAILQNMLGENNDLEAPQSRIEVLLLALLEKLETSAPAIPEEDGDYKLHVSGGTATWETIS